MTGQYRTGLDNITPEERAEVERIAREITDGIGVGTVDLPPGSKNTGQRHRLRGPLQEYLGFKVEYGIAIEDDTGKPFGFFCRQEMAESPT